MRNYIGVDIGGTKCAVCLGEARDGDMRVTGKKQIATEGAPLRVLGRCKEMLDALLAENGLDYSAVAGIGISCGGPLDSRKGLILSPPNLPGWDGIGAVDFFVRETGIPTALQNDANACALAEWRFGAGRGLDNVIFLTFGTGLGAGLILDGRLYSGTNDMAGEVGHIRMEAEGPVGYGKAGSAEGFCSGGGIGRLGAALAAEARARGEDVRLLREAGDERDITARKIAQLALEGDEFCREIYRRVGEELGRFLSILIDTLNPQRIVLGGVFMRSEALLRPAMEAAIAREALPLSAGVCEIVPAALGEQIGDYAALGVATLAAPAEGVGGAAVDRLIARHPELERYREELEAL